MNYLIAGGNPRAPPASSQTTIATDPPTDAFSSRPLIYFRSGLDNWLTTTSGNCPSWWLKNLFLMTTSAYRLGELFGLNPRRERDRDARRLPAFRRWLESDVPLAGQLVRELAINVFKQNRLMHGRLTIGGEIVDLK
jgi:poly(3-hydroxyalkanoate) synthetase